MSLSRAACLWAAALLAGVVLAACAVNPATGGRNLVFSSVESEAVLPYSSRQLITKKCTTRAKPERRREKSVASTKPPKYQALANAVAAM